MRVITSVMRVRSAVVVCLAAFLLTSCATIFNPLMQDVDVTSSVP